MALAPYFSKAGLGAAALMQDMGCDRLASLVEPLAVRIAFGPDAVQSPEGRVLLELTVNLLARFYPTLQFAPEGPGADAHAASLQDLARSINPEIDFRGPDDRTPCIAVGNVRPVRDTFCVYVGSKDWVAHVSTQSARTLGTSANPFGAGAAACIGTAFVFRHLFHEQLGVPAPDQELSLSMASYDVGRRRSTGTALDRDLGVVALVGAGAIGNAAVWGLARTQATGDLHVIDGEVVDDTNPQRYVLTAAADVRTQKVALAARHLAGTRLTVHQHAMSWANFVTATNHDCPPLVACALDTAEDRCAVQSSLPEMILNAWTQPGDVGISRHEFLGKSACLACLYWPRTQRKNFDELVKEAIRYSGELMEVRDMLYLRTPLDDAWLDRLSADMGVVRATLTPFRNKTLDEFYREGICGGHVMAVRGAKVVVPMAFQSAFAGLMLAAEIIKTAPTHKLKADMVTTKIDLLRPIGTRLSEAANKTADIRCICRDPIYVRRYEQKYPHRTRHAPAHDGR